MADDREVSSSRRALLRHSSLGGIALLVAACGAMPKKADPVESDEEYCSSRGGGSSTPPTEEEFKAAVDKLWLSFDDGTLAWAQTGKVDLEPGVKDDREHFHGAFLKNNWHKWQRCERLTNRCAWMAGMLSAMLREKMATPKITKDQFETAARAVKDLQKRSSPNPASFTGIAC